MQRLMSKEDKRATRRPRRPQLRPPLSPLPSPPQSIRMHESSHLGDSQSVRRSGDSGQGMRDGAGQQDEEEEEARSIQGRPPLNLIRLWGGSRGTDGQQRLLASLSKFTWSRQAGRGGIDKVISVGHLAAFSRRTFPRAIHPPLAGVVTRQCRHRDILRAPTD